MKTIFSTKFTSITSAAIVIAAAGLFSRVLGVVRDRVLAGQFGAGSELDIYYAAFQVPDFIFNLVGLGAISAGFIPVFIRLLSNEDKGKYKDNEESWDFFNNTLNIVGTLLIVLGIAAVFLLPRIMPYITPGFPSEKLNLTIALTRLMFISPFLLGLSGIVSGALQSFKRFLVFSLAPVMYNLGIIFGALFFVKYLGIYGLAFGVIIGAFMHLLFQLPSLISLGWRWRLIFRIKESSFLEMIKMMAPRIMALATSQINLIIITAIASTLLAGSLAVFNFANNLQSFSLGIFAVSFAVAAFPSLSQSFAQGDLTEYKRIFFHTFRQLLFFIIPISILLIILRAQVVRIILGSGEFDWQATNLTANTLGIFALSLFAQALLPLIARAFYAMRNTVTPFITSVISVAINIAASYWFARKFGVLGLAIGFSVSAIVNFVLMFVIFRLKIKDFGEKILLQSLVKISFASLAMGVCVQYVKTGLGLVVDMNRFWGVFLQGALAGLIGLAVFTLVGYWLKMEELQNLIGGMKRRLWKQVKVEVEKESIVN